jgi:peptidoglycan/LPS O-acetylase OafA/YrhL
MQKNSHYLPALDGMRALSILMVLVAHLGFDRIIPGGLGVNIFFFISGLLITNLLLVEFEKKRKINLKNFFIRRILRLYPPLLVMILIVCLVPVLNKNLTVKELFAAIFYFENYFFINNFYEISNHVMQNKFRIIWSLSIEEHFYLVYPFIFALVVKRKTALIAATSVIILIALFSRIYIAYIYGANAYSDAYTYSATLCRADSIMFGCLSSVLIYFDPKKLYVKFASLIPVFLFAFVILFHSLIYRNEFYRQTFRYSLQSIAIMLIIPAILYSSRYIGLNKILSSKPLVFIGKLSYSLYLFHPLTYILVATYVTHKVRSPLYCVAGLAGAFTLALLSFYLVEKPIMSLRRKFGSEAGKNDDAGVRPDTILVKEMN